MVAMMAEVVNMAMITIIKIIPHQIITEMDLVVGPEDHKEVAENKEEIQDKK